MPVEGRREMHSFTFYEPVPEKPAANDDLDLAILWMKALSERGTRIDARVLGEYWLKYVCVDWNEYGVGKTNLRDGFPPPLSGQFRNERWRDSNGAWIRSETWACLAPGCPSIAVQYAWEDACVDHGAAEGTYAELFTAALQSAAFVETDRDRLLQTGLAYVPPASAVARSVRVAMGAYKRGLDLRAAREAVVEASRSTGWFMAPQNVAFVVLGFLYGEGDFGKSVCATVNCGDDTDSTGATVGALLGILLGTKGIPEAWRKPVGDAIQNVAIAGFQSPRTVLEFTDQTVFLAKKMMEAHSAPVAIHPGAPTDLSRARELKLIDLDLAKSLWARSPYRISHDLEGVRVTLDFLGDPKIEAGKPYRMKVALENLGAEPLEVKIGCRQAQGLEVDPARISLQLAGKPGASAAAEIHLRADEINVPILRGSFEISRDGKVLGNIPFALAAEVTVSKDDLALASLGAKATSDSELDREKGCTPMAIDGVIPGESDFDAKRWHSALTPHPHWVAVEIPEARAIRRVIIHFADPAGHPVDFEGLASTDGRTWSAIFSESGYKERRRYEKVLEPVRLKHFKLVIKKSANPQFVDAAQIGELELLAK